MLTSMILSSVLRHQPDTAWELGAAAAGEHMAGDLKANAHFKGCFSVADPDLVLPRV